MADESRTPDPSGRVTAALERGDDGALAELYAEIAPSLYAWAELRVRQRFRHALDPADVAQEVWLRAVQAWPGFDPAAIPFRAWLFGVAKNVLFEAQRQLWRTDREGGAGGRSSRLEAIGNVPAELTTVTRRVARDDNLRAFLAEIGGLDEIDRRLVLHIGFEGLERAEVARRLDLGYEAVAKRWQRLRARLAGSTRILTLLEV